MWRLVPFVAVGLLLVPEMSSLGLLRRHSRLKDVGSSDGKTSSTFRSCTPWDRSRNQGALPPNMIRFARFGITHTRVKI
jgi:hypothetical protein